MALMKLIRYTKCVLFGASTVLTRSKSLRRKQPLSESAPEVSSVEWVMKEKQEEGRTEKMKEGSEGLEQE